MKKLIFASLILCCVFITDLSADEKEIKLYLSTDIPVVVVFVPDTSVPETFSYGTGIIPSGLNLNFGVIYGILGFSSSIELSFSGEMQKGSAAGVGDFFYLDFQIGPEIVFLSTAKHMFVVNLSIKYEYMKELKGAEITALTDYDETYGTVEIETNRKGSRFSFTQFLRYDYFVTQSFGIGPKIEFMETIEGGFGFSADFNFIYVF